MKKLENLVVKKIEAKQAMVYKAYLYLVSYLSFNFF